MHRLPLFAAAIACGAVASLSAQSPLIYDNGPLITHPTGGAGGLAASALETAAPLSLNVYGYGAQAPLNYSLADDFAVGVPWIVNDLEFFVYQTNSTTTSTITGVYCEIYNGDPGAGGLPVTGSPGIATNLLSATSTNVFSNTYRVLLGTLTNTARPIMAVKVALPAPVTLTPGVYWIQMMFSGSLTSGPWVPPITVLGQGSTGNAKQKLGLAGTWAAILNGTTHTAGLPFRIYGTSGVPAASITNTLLPSCGTTTITVAGAPVLGGFVRTTLGNVTGLGLIGYGFSTSPTPYCGCAVGHEWGAVVVNNSTTLDIPMNISLWGIGVRVQGADFGGAGGCPSPQVTFTDTYQIQVY